MPHLVDDPESRAPSILPCSKREHRGEQRMAPRLKTRHRHRPRVRLFHGEIGSCLPPDPAVGFAKPRGLRFGSDGLYCVGQDHVVVFDFCAGAYLGVAVTLP